MSQTSRGILWFRNDLRLHDHESLHEALSCLHELLLVYVFDPRVYLEKASLGMNLIGIHQAQFVIDSVQDLRLSIQSRGGELLVRIGHPEEILYELAKKHRTRWVFCNRERTMPDLEVQNQLEKNLWAIGQEMRYGRGKMLYHTQDLPFPVTQTPDTFPQFRKEIERSVAVRKPLPTPDDIMPMKTKADAGDIPSLEDLGFMRSSRSIIRGGESAGLTHLDHLVSNLGKISNYSNAGKRIKWDEDSLLFSPYLAKGCLSPKMIFHKIDELRRTPKLKAGVELIERNLRLRDFLRLLGKKHNTPSYDSWRSAQSRCTDLDEEEMEKFSAWRDGRTGHPLVDALMSRLKETGFISFRGRELVANFLIHSYKINWDLGAAYFQSVLIDYDPCSNWESWQYLAGIGSCPHEIKNFDPDIQSKRLDPKGEFARIWTN